MSHPPTAPRHMNRGKTSQPMWFVTPITVMIVSTSPSMATWIGITNTSSGMATAPVSASIGWNAIAAQAVGGRLAWWTAWAMRNGLGRCIQRCVQ